MGGLYPGAGYVGSYAPLGFLTPAAAVEPIVIYVGPDDREIYIGMNDRTIQVAADDRTIIVGEKGTT